jgi:hypothetical protein
MVNYLAFAAMQPDIMGAANRGFQQGREQAQQRARDNALRALAAGDESGIQGLMQAGDLEGAMRYQMFADSRRAREQDQQRQQALGGAIAGMEGVPEPVKAYISATGDTQGGMEVFKFIGSLSAQQREQAKIEAEQEVADAIASGRQNDPAVRARLVTVLGVKGMLDQMDREGQRDLEAQRFREQQAANRDASARGWAGVQIQAANAARSGQGDMRPPPGYRWTPDGNLEAIPGGPATATKPLSAGEKTAMRNAKFKVQTLGAIERQIAAAEKALEAADAARMTGILAGRVPGGLSGTADAADKAIANLAPLIRQLTRVPGEGAMSDYESRLAQAGLPSRADTTQGRRQAIADLRALVQATKAGYNDILSEYGGQSAPAQQRLRFNPATRSLE